jgi:hypothetical protein
MRKSHGVSFSARLDNKETWSFNVKQKKKQKKKKVRLVSRKKTDSVSQSVGRSAGRSVGRLVGRSVGAPRACRLKRQFSPPILGHRTIVCSESAQNRRRRT